MRNNRRSEPDAALARRDRTPPPTGLRSERTLPERPWSKRDRHSSGYPYPQSEIGLSLPRIGVLKAVVLRPTPRDAILERSPIGLRFALTRRCDLISSGLQRHTRVPAAKRGAGRNNAF